MSTPDYPPPAGPNGPPPGGPVPPPYGAPQPPHGRQGPQQGWPQQQPTPQGWAQQQPTPQGWAPPQPPPGQPHGAQPVPGQLHGAQPAFGWQPPPVKKGSGKVKLVLTLVVVAALAVGGYFLNKSAPASAKPGDCINIVSASITDPKIEKVECGAPNASYKVAKNLDSASDDCPAGDYGSYSESGRRGSGFTLCLMLNAAEGDCFKTEGSFVAGKTTKVTCDASADFTVSKVVTGSTDKAACGSDGNELVYSEPATTLCRVAADGSGTGAAGG
ncbi:LppU/SCO3897 family protein [Umezawaea sp.]|uniref:LppU/SCO3897 family protein n=1 Tax=Umezawaea sp. TaxID=1955258 RepID=UPI002ED2EACA